MKILVIAVAVVLVATSILAVSVSLRGVCGGLPFASSYVPSCRGPGSSGLQLGPNQSTTLPPPPARIGFVDLQYSGSSFTGVSAGLSMASFTPFPYSQAVYSIQADWISVTTSDGLFLQVGYIESYLNTSYGQPGWPNGVLEEFWSSGGSVYPNQGYVPVPLGAVAFQSTNQFAITLGASGWTISVNGNAIKNYPDVNKATMTSMTLELQCGTTGSCLPGTLHASSAMFTSMVLSYGGTSSSFLSVPRSVASPGSGTVDGGNGILIGCPSTVTMGYGNPTAALPPGTTTWC